MPKVNTVKKGDIVEINSEPHIIREIEVKSPSSRGSQTLYKIRFQSVTSKSKLERTFTGDDKVGEIDFAKKPLQYLYRDGEQGTFMDGVDYTQFTLLFSDLGEKGLYLIDGAEGLLGYLVEGVLVDIELPPSVDLRIKETTPSVKGTGTGRKKQAVMETGLNLLIPEYLDVDEVIKINTETGKFMERVS